MAKHIAPRPLSRSLHPVSTQTMSSLWCLSQLPQRVRGLKLQAQGATEHARYIDEVAQAPRPDNIQPLLRVLEAQGQTVVSPADRAGLHPLLVPLAKGPAPANGGTPNASVKGGEVVTGLLRWADAGISRRGMAVVSMSTQAPAMTLVARNTDEFLHRALAEEDHAEGPGKVAEAAGADAAKLYSAGSVAESNLPRIEQYLTRKAGMFTDTAEKLVLNHLERGDELSALITGEWYMRTDHFGPWARPYEFNALLYRSIGRSEECRDSARIALRMPWWTLTSGFEVVKGLAELSGDAASVRSQLDEDTRANSRGPLPPGISVGTKSDDQLAMEEAGFLLNTVAAGEAQWDDIRKDLAAQYVKAGLKDVAEFVTAAG